MHLIVGATGSLGGMIAGGLLERGEAVRALVRDPAPAAALEEAGAELARGDLKEPATLEEACRGVRRIVATATAAARGGEDTVERVDREGYRGLIAAAGKAGVEQLVFVSAHGFAADSPVGIARAKAATEAALRASGLGFTILRPVFFMDSWIGWVLGSQLEKGPEVTVIGSADRRYSFVAAADVAALALAVLGRPEARNASIPLSAGTCSLREVVGWIGAATGREIAIREAAPGTRVPFLPPLVSDLWSWGATGGMEDLETAEVARAYGLELTPPRAWVAAAFGGTPK